MLLANIIITEYFDLIVNFEDCTLTFEGKTDVSCICRILSSWLCLFADIFHVHAL